MKKILILFHIGLLFFQANIASAIQVVSHSVPRGTVIPIRFSDSINSDKLYAGDIIPIKVVDDVYVDNVKVFAKDSIGVADIEKTISSGSHGRAGYIAIQEAQVKDINGVYRKVQLNVTEKGVSRRPSAVTLSVVGVLLILIPFGIWREGDPAYLSSKKIFNAVTIDN